MINRVVLVGRITKDLELRKTPNGASVVAYTLAVGRIKTQEGQPEADFVNCVTWNRQAETMNQYLHKGSLIAIEGRIQTRSYDNNQGQKVYVTEVVTDSVQFLESKSQSNNQQQTNSYQSYQQANEVVQPVDDIEGIDMVDDLPF